MSALGESPRLGWDPAGKKGCVRSGWASHKSDLPPEQSAHLSRSWTTVGSTLLLPPWILVCSGRTPRDVAGRRSYIRACLDEQSVSLFLWALPRSCGLAWQTAFSAPPLQPVFIRGPAGALSWPLNKVTRPLNEGAVWEGKAPYFPGDNYTTSERRETSCL